MRSESAIWNYYETLARAWGPQHWWPAETPFEVILGAYLTQNTAWTNVEKAFANLRSVDAISVGAIRRLPLSELEQLIRPAGYFRQKAARLKTFVSFLDQHYRGSLARMFAQPTDRLRAELLALNGVGPETADSILLYAGHHEVFVVDAYTRRIFERHGITTSKSSYEEIRQLVERALANSVGPAPVEPGAGNPAPPIHRPSQMSCALRSGQAQVLNEFHGLIVQVGKHHCLSRVPACKGCPLAPFLAKDGPILS
ncbi:MAG TPA: endonuclease III domain-containing protein [Clostridia bacterium]|nr:endonuclease III domain-containing protein [Clostridia bacterium]